MISNKIIETITHHGHYSVTGPTTLPLHCSDNFNALFTHYGFKFPNGRYSVLHYGNVQASNNVLVRISSNCQWSFYFGSMLCDCQWQLEEAKQRIKNEGNGMIIFAHDQHGKGIPIEDHWKVYAEGQRRNVELVVDAYKQIGFKEDYRNYDDIIDILQHYGITSIRLLSNNPKRKKHFEEKGIKVCIENLEQPIHSHLKSEYASKKHKLNHFLKISDEELGFTQLNDKHNNQ